MPLLLVQGAPCRRNEFRGIGFIATSGSSATTATWHQSLHHIP